MTPCHEASFFGGHACPLFAPEDRSQWCSACLETASPISLSPPKEPTPMTQPTPSPEASPTPGRRVVVAFDPAKLPEGDDGEPYDVLASITSQLDYDKVEAHIAEQDETRTALERAAPSLLAALQLCVDALETGDTDPERAIHQGAQAIAAAEGRA